MSRQYGITTYGANQYNTYVNTQTTGPLSTNQYPHVMPPHNSGILIGIHPNPPKFYPSDSTDTVSNARQEYSRTVGPLNTPLAHSTKYIAPTASSLFTLRFRVGAIYLDLFFKIRKLVLFFYI